MVLGQPTIRGMIGQSPKRTRRLRIRLRRLHEQEGFSLVEAMAAITVLAIGIFGAAQAMTIGLSTTGSASPLVPLSINRWRRPGR